MIRTAVLALVAVAAMVVAPRGAAYAQSLPAAEMLIARHDSLVGGRAALEAHQSMRMMGSFTIPAAGIDAPLEVLKRRPNQYVFRTSIPQLGDVMQGYDGTTAWAVQPGQGARILSGDEAARIVEQADFFGDLHDLTKFASVTTIEETVFHGARVYKVRFTRHSGEVVHEYFNIETGLSAGGSTSTNSPAGPQETSTILAEYREFEGVRLATQIVQRSTQFESVIRIVLVEFDRLDAAAMAPPDTVRRLIRPANVSPESRSSPPSSRPNR